MEMRQSKRATLIANNWDRFGGRALDVLNNYILSIKLNCDFAFYWPEDHRFPEMEEQVNFFSQSFIEKYRITTCPLPENIEYVDFSLLTLSEAKRLTTVRGKVQFFKNPDFFSLPKFTDEDEVLARRVYAETAKSIMSPEILFLWRELEEKYSHSEAVHGRYGDLVTGSFNQYVDTGKYIDSYSLKTLLEKLIRENRKVVILSDSIQISKALEKLIGVKLIPVETAKSKAKKLTYFELQTIELLIMASCKSINASSSSAYSILASRIGNVPIKLIREELSFNTTSGSWAENREFYYSKFNRKIRAQLRCRDSMSFVQHYWRNFDLETVREFIWDANKVNREYVLSLCLDAIVAKIDGDSKRAKKTIEKAEILARSRIKIHHDPLLLTLLVKYCLVRIDFPVLAETIKNELSLLEPFQFSKQNALMFIFECEESKNIFESNETALENIWEEIRRSSNSEIIFALLKLLVVSELKSAERK